MYLFSYLKLLKLQLETGLFSNILVVILNYRVIFFYFELVIGFRLKNVDFGSDFVLVKINLSDSYDTI